MTLTDSSSNWLSSTSEGACDNRSVALAVFGKAIVSRRLLTPANSITRRSKPKAMPPCGGVPYSNASSRNPNRSWPPPWKNRAHRTSFPAHRAYKSASNRRRSHIRSTRGHTLAREFVPGSVSNSDVFFVRTRKRMMLAPHTLCSPHHTRATGNQRPRQT